MWLRAALLSALVLVTPACMCAWFGCEPNVDPGPEPALGDHTVSSADGTPIHYLRGGEGDVALVFVHGWLGNADWWRPTLERFRSQYTVVALDLAGHGLSGRRRTDWSVERFADDVVAVANELRGKRLVLLGHSMSGAITVAAAARLGERVALLVPVDTLQDFEWDLPPEVWAQFFGGLHADFPNAVENFFRGMLFAPSSPPDVVARVVSEARAADPELAIPMLERARDFDLKSALRSVRAPFHAIESDRNPTKLDTNRRYVARFEAELLPGVGHWPMLEDARAFGDALARVLASEGLAAR